MAKLQSKFQNLNTDVNLTWTTDGRQTDFIIHKPVLPCNPGNKS